mmetsp:Transcript_20023/g.29044  ORF Transcript_20023/g.29044 Transcript_20023/m.29044 type:complete len:201 (-) Transcript_20023:62-664(-)|eukprot:7845036-Ditylum_brightwellii.AAC.1
MKLFSVTGSTAILCYSAALCRSFTTRRNGPNIQKLPGIMDSNGNFHKTMRREAKVSKINKMAKLTLDLVRDDDENRQNAQPFTLKQRNPYDVHVYYSGPNERDEAMKLREKMQEKFKWMRFYSPKDRPIGPHPIPMWEADFGAYENRHMWSEVCDFIEEEHGNLSVLIHPHSLDGDYADHTKNALWVGDILVLQIEGWRQ